VIVPTADRVLFLAVVGEIKMSLRIMDLNIDEL
jgi:hypothetical protein